METLRELEPQGTEQHNFLLKEQEKRAEREKKDRKNYFKDYNNRPEIKEKRRRLRLEKERAKQEEKRQQEQDKHGEYYGAEAIKVLINFAKYVDINKEKRKLWLDFNWTLKDCQKSFEKGHADIIMIMKLNQVAEKLIKDYWETAKDEERQKGKSWGSLDQEERQRLIRYWGMEKTRKEKGYRTEAERLSQESKEKDREIEIQKHHEERGKKGCKCWQCEEIKEIRRGIKKQQDRLINEV